MGVHDLYRILSSIVLYRTDCDLEYENSEHGDAGEVESVCDVVRRRLVVIVIQLSAVMLVCVHGDPRRSTDRWPVVHWPRNIIIIVVVVVVVVEQSQDVVDARAAVVGELRGMRVTHELQHAGQLRVASQ